MNATPASRLPNEGQNINQIIALIVDLIKPEQIFLISADFNYSLRENLLYGDSFKKQKPGSYCLLILTEGRADIPIAEQQIDLLMKSGLQNVNISMMDVLQFTSKLKEKNAFAEMVVSNAMLYYERPTGSSTPGRSYGTQMMTGFQ